MWALRSSYDKIPYRCVCDTSAAPMGFVCIELKSKCLQCHSTLVGDKCGLTKNLQNNIIARLSVNTQYVETAKAIRLVPPKENIAGAVTDNMRRIWHSCIQSSWVRKKLHNLLQNGLKKTLKNVNYQVIR